MADQVPAPLSKAQAANNVVNMLHDVAERVANDDDHDALISILRALQQKPAIKSTEFWMSLLLNGVGVYFCLKPETATQGATMMLLATSLYTLSRTVVKAAEAKQQPPAVVPVPAAT